MTKIFCLLIFLVSLIPQPGRAGIETDFEVGAVFATRNDTRIPGKGGSDLSLVDDLKTSAAPAFRLRVGYRFGQRHLMTALYAPLQVNARGTLDRQISFMDATYPANTPLLAVYRFNSYRLTYRYSFIRQENLEIAAGLTGKIRDAETSLYGTQAKRKTNVGFVPLLNLHLSWRPLGGMFGILLDADALAAPQGRAEDVLVALTWRVRDNLDLRIGYRTVEGGADNDEVYSFAWLHYVVAGMAVAF